jgi:integrase
MSNVALRPYRHAGKWCVDLRTVIRRGEQGRHARLPVPADAPYEDAERAVTMLLAKMVRQGGAAAAPDPQPMLPGVGRGDLGLDGESLLTSAAAEWLERKQVKKQGSRRYVDEYAAAVRGELGHFRVGEFEPPAGDDLVLSYVRKLSGDGKSEKTQANRLSTLFQILGFCKERRWLSRLPVRPLTEAPAGKPEYEEIAFYTESDFRRLRAEIFSRAEAGGNGWGKLSADERADRIARRRLYLSFAFYTGLHTADLDKLITEHTGIDFGHYVRNNSKSSRWVKREQFKMPEQLLLDCQDELKRLGREWRPGEKICGGPWGRRGPAVMTVAAKHLGLPAVDFRTFRRSCAREYALRGWNERDVSEVLGHVDQRMIREVYLRVPTEVRAPVKLDWTVQSSTHPWLAMRRPRGVVPYTEFSDAMAEAMKERK